MKKFCRFYRTKVIKQNYLFTIEPFDKINVIDYDRVPIGRNTFLDEVKAKGLSIKKIKGERLFADFQFKEWGDEQFNFEK